MAKIAFITGAGGGLGQPVVKSMLARGFHVIATDLDITGLQSISANHHLRIFQADITKDEPIRALADEMGLDQTGLDVLICMAGIYDTFPVTETDPEKLRQMMAVNFLGTASIVNIMLKPLMKKQGLVIVISSESYKIQSMFQPYMISKAALEAYSRAAWQELALKGVSLSVIRPGAINTPLLRWMERRITLKDDSVYKKEFEAALKQSKKMVGKVSPAEQVAGIIVKAATARKPKRYYLVNNNPLLSLISLFPASLIDRAIVRRFRERE